MVLSDPLHFVRLNSLCSNSPSRTLRFRKKCVNIRIPPLPLLWNVRLAGVDVIKTCDARFTSSPLCNNQTIGSSSPKLSVNSLSTFFVNLRGSLPSTKVALTMPSYVTESLHDSRRTHNGRRGITEHKMASAKP